MTYFNSTIKHHEMLGFCISISATHDDNEPQTSENDWPSA